MSHVVPETFQVIARFSDWLRLALLAKHGGVWLDATLLLTAPLQSLVNESATFSGVHLEDFVGKSWWGWEKLVFLVDVVGVSWAVSKLWSSITFHEKNHIFSQCIFEMCLLLYMFFSFFSTKKQIDMK